MPVEHAQLYFQFLEYAAGPRYAGVRGVTGQKRGPARGLVTAAVAAREYWA